MKNKFIVLMFLLMIVGSLFADEKWFYYVYEDTSIKEAEFLRVVATTDNSIQIIGTLTKPATGDFFFKAVRCEGIGITLMFQLLDYKKRIIATRFACQYHINHLVAEKAIAEGDQLQDLKEDSFAEKWNNGSYATVIQPIWDKHCLNCHDINQSAGKAVATSADRTEKGILSLRELERKSAWLARYPKTFSYMEKSKNSASHKSSLLLFLENNHAGVKLTDEELLTIRIWLDMNSPEFFFSEGTAINITEKWTESEFLEFLSLTGLRKGDILESSLSSRFKISITRPELSPSLRKLEGTELNRAIELIKKLQ